MSCHWKHLKGDGYRIFHSLKFDIFIFTLGRSYLQTKTQRDVTKLENLSLPSRIYFTKVWSHKARSQLVNQCALARRYNKAPGILLVLKSFSVEIFEILFCVKKMNGELHKVSGSISQSEGEIHIDIIIILMLKLTARVGR